MSANNYSQNTRKYSKRNFVELLELITPEVYRSEDISLSGLGNDLASDLINVNLELAKNLNSVISISALDQSLSGAAQYFVKQNKLTNVTPYSFETDILLPLGKSMSDFDTSGEFVDYLSGTLLPMIVPPSKTDDSVIQANLGTLSSLPNNTLASNVHSYLIDHLGWFYFLNTSADGGLDYSPSSYVLESFASLYRGDKLETVEGIKGVMEYLWRNNSVCSFDAYIPVDYVSGAADAILDTSTGDVATYTSGIQKLDALKTLVDVVYSPSYLDEQDFRVKDAFDDYIDADQKVSELVSQGPLRKFQTLMGYGMADVSDEIEQVGLIYDIENVKAEHLQYVADLIGFKLRGRSESKWRNQLRIALDLYKSTGTLKAIQTAINALIIDSVFDVSGSVEELWESYIPHLIWYALGTESALFRDLNTWTVEKANQAGVFQYSTSSLEENLRLVTDSILLDLYRKFPQNFVFNSEEWPVPKFHKLDDDGCDTGLYTLVGDPQMSPFHVHPGGFSVFENEAIANGQLPAYEASIADGPLGFGIYMAGIDHPPVEEKPLYLEFKGDLNFVFNYRGRSNYPIPPFEEVKYYKNCIITPDLVEYLVERLKCFEVTPSFADSLGSYVLSSTVNNNSNLGYLNDFLFFFREAQIAPNFDDVMFSISNYEKNLLSLWNGKSSHLFVNFADTDFDFSKSTIEGDGKYALLEASRVVKEFSPAHAIEKVNLAASSSDTYSFSGVLGQYIGHDHDDTFAALGSGSVLTGYEQSGAPMSFVAGGGDDGRGSDGGRGGLNTFKRPAVDSILDPLLSTSSVIGNVPRKSVRRRNFKYVLPHEGYYDRTGFNGPVSFDASVLENSTTSSLGMLTLGYIPSACSFHPVEDAINPSGVWDSCETLNSPRNFSGIDTSNTFPFRGLDAFVASATDMYVDRCQVPGIYIAMHKHFEKKALDHAQDLITNDASSYDASTYFWNGAQSLANEAIASGLVLNSFADYENFSFGLGPHKLHRDYARYFAQHPLNPKVLGETGGNIFSHVFGKGLYNCDFSVEGSAVGSFISDDLDPEIVVNSENVWNALNTASYEASTLGEAEFRNAHILSGIEFCDLSSAPSFNQFMLFHLGADYKSSGEDRYLVGNTVIKSKAIGGFPRLRFDLSSYGDRRNYFIKDHKFRLSVNALVGEENSNILGGGTLGVWIHTEPVEGVVWTWTPQGKWMPSKESETTTEDVRNSLAHKYQFDLKLPAKGEETQYCLEGLVDPATINNHTLLGKKKSQFEKFTVEFDTRNFTDQNNSEYLDIIPLGEENYKIFEEVHTDDRNYIVEVFFYPTPDLEKYLLIDSLELEDKTLKGWAGIGTGKGIETSGTPLRRFVEEYKLDFDEYQLAEILKFYNGLSGKPVPDYTTPLASRDASITSGILEVSGGSRLNYRESPYQGSFTTVSGFGNFESIDLV